MFESVSKTKKAYVKIMEQISEQIRSGNIRPGETLPVERQLMEEFNVSRSTIRQALSALEVMGMLEVRSGIGAIVCEPSDDRSGKFGVELENTAEPWEILEARMTIEPSITVLATTKANSQDLLDIRKVLDQANECIVTNDYARFEDLDNEFHYMIAKATHNEMVRVVAATFVQDRQVGLWRHLKFHTVGRLGVMDESHFMHESIFDAIAGRNPHEAEKRAIDHYRRLRRLVFEE